MRVFPVAAAVALVALTGVPPAQAGSTADRAAGATTVGGHVPSASIQCNGGVNDFSYLQVSTAGGAPSYVFPSGGVVTSFRTSASAPEQVRPLVFRLGALAGHYTLVGKTAFAAVPSGPDSAIPARIVVQQGDLLGLQISGTVDCATPAPLGSNVAYAAKSAFNPDTSTDFVAQGSFASQRINLSAQLEPDADQDGYGDLSQDGCPALVSVQSSCPAVDTLRRGKVPKKVHHRVVTIKFTSDAAGATFTCTIDHKLAKACSSPFLAHYRPGRHIVRITATDPTTHVSDPTPLVVRFKVVLPEKK